MRRSYPLFSFAGLCLSGALLAACGSDDDGGGALFAGGTAGAAGSGKGGSPFGKGGASAAGKSGAGGKAGSAAKGGSGGKAGGASKGGSGGKGGAGGGGKGGDAGEGGSSSGAGGAAAGKGGAAGSGGQAGGAAGKAGGAGKAGAGGKAGEGQGGAASGSGSAGEGGAAPGGAAGESGSAGAGGSPVDAARETCDRYIACTAKTKPGELGPIASTYGEGGTCFTSSPKVCQDACQTGLEQGHTAFPAEPACKACDEKTSCAAPSGFYCNQDAGTCVVCAIKEDCAAGFYCSAKKCVSCAGGAPGADGCSTVGKACTPDAGACSKYESCATFGDGTQKCIPAMDNTSSCNGNGSCNIAPAVCLAGTCVLPCGDDGQCDGEFCVPDDAAAPTGPKHCAPTKACTIGGADCTGGAVCLYDSAVDGARCTKEDLRGKPCVEGGATRCGGSNKFGCVGGVCVADCDAHEDCPDGFCSSLETTISSFCGAAPDGCVPGAGTCGAGKICAFDRTKEYTVCQTDLRAVLCTAGSSACPTSDPDADNYSCKEAKQCSPLCLDDKECDVGKCVGGRCM